MSTERNKWIDAVGKLLQLTQDGVLKWEARQPPAHLSDQSYNYVEAVYVAHYKDRTLKLYELNHKVERINSMLGGVTAWLEKPEYIWVKTPVLELLDERDLSTWTFPNTELLTHLLNAVRYQVTGVKDFLEEILAEA